MNPLLSLSQHLAKKRVPQQSIECMYFTLYDNTLKFSYSTISQVKTVKLHVPLAHHTHKITNAK